MHVEEFRRQAHSLVDWMADYLAAVGRHPVIPDVAPGQIRRQIPSTPPGEGEPFERIFADFEQQILPGMCHWRHPGFFAYFPAAGTPESLLAEMLTATLSAQCMSWQTSPAATELEQAMMDWLRQLLGLPEAFTGVIQDTASTATLVALITARDRMERSLETLTVYTSSQAHSSVTKGARLAGFDPRHVRLIATDQTAGMNVAALREAIKEDQRMGLVPAAVVATIGTTATGAVDPVAAIVPVAKAAGAWLHVDAAYAGSTALLPEYRHYFDGIEHADSFLMNPHKWLGVHFDCTAFFVQDLPALLRSFSANPEYLRTAHDDSVVNFRDWGIQLGRRFRALKLWMVIRSLGVNGLQTMLRKHCAMARDFAAGIVRLPGWELVAPVSFGLVCFRHHPDRLQDPTQLAEHNARILRQVNSSGRVWLTHAVVDDRYFIRLALGNESSSSDRLHEALQLLDQAARDSVSLPGRGA